MKTILVPVDLSAATTHVCEAACALAKRTDTKLLLLHVVEPLPVLINDYYAFGAGATAEAMAAGAKVATQRLAALARLCAKRGANVQTMQRTGHPATTILAQARRTTAYIVIGSHGHGSVFDLLVGSTTHGVLRKAKCPVLVVPVPPS